MRSLLWGGLSIFAAIHFSQVGYAAESKSGTQAPSKKSSKGEGREIVVEKPVAPGMPTDFNPQSQGAKILSVPFGKPKAHSTPPPVEFSTRTPLFLDVRSPFEFETVHVKQSQPVRWRDFIVLSQDNVVQGLDKESAGLARRLATLGVHPDRLIYVVGKDLEGNGEEGRVAWMLSYLGVKDVRLRKFSDVQEKKIAGEKDNQVVSPWQKPVVDESLRVSIEEAKSVFKSGIGEVQWVDAREIESYKAGHVLGARFFDWRDLSPFEKNQYDSAQVLKIAKKQGLATEGKRLVVYSDDTARASLVVFIFKKAGLNAAVLDTGFEVIQSSLEMTR